MLLLLVVRVTLTLLGVLPLVVAGASVAMMVPLNKDTSNVDVCVTVTVSSSVVEVVFAKLSGKDVVSRAESEVDDIVELSAKPEDEVGREVVMVELSMEELAVDSTPDTVSWPRSDSERTVLPVAAGTSVSFDVVVPSFTLICTTLAVTVASGALFQS